MRRKIVFISICLIFILLLGIGVSYSLWNISISQDTANMAETKCFDLSISNQENNISLENAYPISNDKGKDLTPYTFTVTNTCDITAEYSVNLEVLNNSTLSSNFIDVMFEGNINLLSSYNTTDKVNSNSVESLKLSTGILKSGESRDYSLRLWIDYDTTLEDLDNEIKTFKAKIVVTGKPINYDGDLVFNFDYTGGEQTFTAPVSGTYRLETWGASGSISNWGGKSGYGGYSTGLLHLNISNIIFLNTGGSGNVRGYNGGDSEECDNALSGGGATHIALRSGLLSTLENYKNDIIIVAGGGGSAERQAAGSGGGILGGTGYKITNNGNLFGTGGSQASGGSGFAHINNSAKLNVNGSFGQGGCGRSISDSGPNGGGGFYGGGATTYLGGAGGGSGYIGSYLLTNKVMYCYNCEKSFEKNTKTIATTCSEETPTSYCAKKGNGYARITLVSIEK